MKYHRHVNVYTFIFYLVFHLKTTHASGALAIQDQVAFIPCHAYTSAKKVPGTVTLIRWLRSTFHKPLYTLDLRSLNSSMSLDASFIHNGKHFPSPETEGRLYLDLTLDPIVLRIDPVSPEDAGQYTCLIDFRNWRSVRSSLDLQVIEPPKEAIIKDTVGRKLEGVIGPYHIGQTIQLSCEGLGGSPTPKAIWRTSTEATQRIDISGSLLIIYSLEREDQWSHYTCTVQNTNMTAPKSVTVIIELILPPLELQLKTNIQQPFIAGQNIQITCQSFGSYPKAHIHWRKNRTVLIGEERIANNGNITTSVIEFIAQPSDDANEIECAAVNPDIDAHILRRIFFMRVYYKPEVNIAILSNQTQLSEGNNFILLCNVKSNPEVNEIVWFFDNIKIFDSESIIIRHMKLYIKHLKRAHTGTFSCHVTNDYGEESASVYIEVQYRPVCLGTEISHIYGQDRSAMNVTCNLASTPSDVTFYWTLRNSSSNHSWSTGYVPHTRIESQTSNFELLCWGRNEIGAQILPCRFLHEEEIKEASLFLPVIIIATLVVIICAVAIFFVIKRRHFFNYDLGSTTSSNNEIPRTNGQTCGRLISTCVMQAPTSSENDCSSNLLEPMKFTSLENISHLKGLRYDFKSMPLDEAKKDCEPSTSSASS